MRDTQLRSWAKAIVWRVTGIAILYLIALFITGGDSKTTLTITIAFHGLRTVLYVAHERLWERVKWGRMD